MKKIRVGIIGCGMITKKRHAPEYFANENVEIYGVYDMNPERLKETATQYSCKEFTTVEDLINCEEIDAVSVCSPNSTHAEYSLMALKSGKHVLCEKPIALKLDDAVKMLNAQKESSKVLMIGHNQRLLPTHIRAKEVLDSGAIGRIISIQTSFKHSGPENWGIDKNARTWFFDKTLANFGVLGDLGSHKIDLIRYLTGEEMASVDATVATLDKKYDSGELINVDDNAFVVFKLTNGLIGNMHLSWTNYGEEDNSTKIYGEKGVMKIFGDYSDDIVLEMRDGSVVKYMVGKIQTNENQTRSGVINEFIKAIVENKEPIITGIDGHNTVAAILACYESAATSKWVDVEYIK